MSVRKIASIALVGTAICVGFVGTFAMASASNWQPFWPAYIEWFSYLLAVFSPKIAATIAAVVTFIFLEERFGRFATTLGAVAVFAVVFTGGDYVIRDAVKNVTFSPHVEAKMNEINTAARKALELQRNVLSGARELANKSLVESKGPSQ